MFCALSIYTVLCLTSVQQLHVIGWSIDGLEINNLNSPAHLFQFQRWPLHLMHEWPFCDGTKVFNKVKLIGSASPEMQCVYIGRKKGPLHFKLNAELYNVIYASVYSLLSHSHRCTQVLYSVIRTWTAIHIDQVHRYIHSFNI